MRIKLLGLKAWSCGAKKTKTKLEETHTKREEEEEKEKGNTSELRQQGLEGEQVFC